jgi:hypothetical protein
MGNSKLLKYNNMRFRVVTVKDLAPIDHSIKWFAFSNINTEAAELLNLAKIRING